MIQQLSHLKHGDFILPMLDGTANQVLTTDGNGVVTWTTQSTGSNKFLSGLSFDTATGVLTGTVTGSDNVTVDLDNRYALSGHTHDYDNYKFFNLKTNGVQKTTVQSEGTLDFIAGDNVALSYSAGGKITISSTDTNTNHYLSGASFNTGNGVLTLTVSGNTNQTVDLDGRYEYAGHKYHRFSDKQQFYDSYDQANYLRLFTENTVFDTFRFRSYSEVEFWNGTAWEAWTQSLDVLFDGREETGFNLQHANKRFRFVIDRSSGWPTTALFVLQSTWSDTSNHTCDVKIETFDGTIWNEKTRWTYSNFQRGMNVHTTSSLHDGKNKMRVEIDIDWTDLSHDYFPFKSLFLLSNYSGGQTLDPWTWDYSGSVNFQALPKSAGENLATQLWVGTQNYAPENHNHDSDYVNITGDTMTGDLSIKGNILLTGDPTTTNQSRMIDFTGFDKEGTTDSSDRAFIRHTVGVGGHAGSTLEISSQNDVGDGISFTTHASSLLRHNGNALFSTGHKPTWSEVEDKPTTFDPSSHNHDGRYLKLNPRLNANGDTIKESGIHIWDVSGATDDPVGASDGLLTTKYWDSSDWAVQMFEDFHKRELHIRNKRSGTWQEDWAQVHTTDNFSTTDVANGVTAHGWGDHADAGYITGNYLPLAGGTLTGGLTINNPASDKKIAFRRTDGKSISIEHDVNQIYFYNETDSISLLSISNAGNLTVPGTLSAKGYNDGNWNTAYGWGNHADEGYITGVTNISGYSGTLSSEDNRLISPSELTKNRLKFGFTSWDNNTSGVYADFLHLRSYQDSSGGNDNLVMFKKSGIGMRIWQAPWGSADAYSSYEDVFTTGDFSAADVAKGVTAYGYGDHAEGGYQASGNYFTDGDTVINMANNDGFVYNDTTNRMYVKLDGTDREIFHTGNFAPSDYQLSGTYNTIIGTDSDINTSGATIIDNLYMTDGVLTSHGTRVLTAADLGIAKPAKPINLILSVVNDTINVTFEQANEDNHEYLVFSAINDSSFGLISVFSPEDFEKNMSVIDDSFTQSGKIHYRVYAVKNGIYSDPLTASVDYDIPTNDVANIYSVSLNTAHFVQWDQPSINSRFINTYKLYGESHTNAASLDKSNSVLLYDGLNTSFMHAVSKDNDFTQFWVDVIYN